MIWRESENIEFKKSTAQLKEGVISLSAMLNKHGACTLFFGIKDDGTICGQEIGKKTTSDISREIRNNLKPAANITILTDEIDGKPVVIVEASGDDTPYSAYGRYYIRIDDSDTYMDSQQLWRFFDTKNRTYSKWEDADSGHDTDSVNEELLIRYIREANEAGRMNYIYRNSQEALSKLNLLAESGNLNNAGYYLFSNHGPVLLKEVIYPTDERMEYTDLRQFRGNIFECIIEGTRYIQNNIHYHSEIVGLRREESPEIPIRAIREIIVNAFAHCNYRDGDCHEIAITKSKVRIYNPGGIIMNTDPTKFASGAVGSKIRNPLIATVLFKNGYIDAFGTGFDRTFRLCADNNVEFDYKNDEFGFTFIFKRDGQKHDDKINDKINDKITGLNADILAIILENNYSTVPEIAEKTGKSGATVYRHINALVTDGVLQRIGSRKSGYWKVLR